MKCTGRRENNSNSGASSLAYDGSTVRIDFGQSHPERVLLVEVDHQRGTFAIDEPSRNKIGLVRMAPFDEQHQFAGRVSSAEDFLGFEPAIETTWGR